MMILTNGCVRPLLCYPSNKKVRCALNKEILDLLNRKKFLEHAVVELVYDFNEKFTVSV